MDDKENLLLKLKQGERAALAKAITLLESSRDSDQPLKKWLLDHLSTNNATNSIRIAISGIPGVGKSTFIETWSLFLLAKDPKLKIAVLSVDPASSVSKGSIMADKTRMSHLSRHEKAFIRPASAEGSFGGLAEYSREIIFLMEEAGYNFIVLETLGVGQTEYAALDMVDFFITLVMPHTGDDLQSLKKGILEISDMILINKADGDLKSHAIAAKHSLKQYAKDCDVLLVSSIEKQGLEEVTKALFELETKSRKSGDFYDQRSRQAEKAFFTALKHQLIVRFRKSLFYSQHKDSLLQKLAQKPCTSGAFAADIAAKAIKMLDQSGDFFGSAAKEE